MGFCTAIANKLFIIILVCLVIAYLPGLPPDLEFTPFTPSEPMERIGPLALNSLMNGAERLFEGKINAPEGLATFNDSLYTSNKGDIVKVEGDKLVIVASLGHKCDGYWEEKKCGRILGISFDKQGFLYAVDAYFGIYKINVITGMTLHIVKTDEPIAEKSVKVANSVIISKDGTLYWTASSTDTSFDDALIALFADASGRLFKYDPLEKTNTLLLDKLYFANGLAFSTNEDFLVVAETGLCRLMRYWLKGPKNGTHDVFVEGLPGIPDNVHLNAAGLFDVAIPLQRTKDVPLASDLVAPYPVVRRFLARLLHLTELPFTLVQNFFPNRYTGAVAHWIANFESMKPLFPKGLLIMQLDQHGNVVSSLQSTDHKVTSVSDLVHVGNYYYLGSPFNDFLGRVKKEEPLKRG